MKKYIFIILLSLFVFSSALAAVSISNAKAVADGSNVKVTWDAVSGMTTYKVFYLSGSLYESGNVGAKTEYIFKNPEPNSGYVFLIRGYKKGSTNASGDAQGEAKFTASGSAASSTSGTTATATGSTASSGGTSSAGTGIQVGAPFPGEGTGSSVTFSRRIQTIINWAAVIGSLLAVYMIVYAGFIYTTSSGNPEALQSAKDQIVGALVGLAMIILIYFLLRLFGVEVSPSTPV